MANKTNVITPIYLVLAAVFFISIPFGVYVWRRHRGTRLTSWLAAIVIMLGLTGLHTFAKRWLPPPPMLDLGGPEAYAGAPWWLAPAWVATSVLDVLINGFFYYATLVVALLYNGYARRWLVLLLAAPIVVTYVIGIDVWRNDLNRHLVAAWGAVYWLAAAGLFTTAAIKGRSKGEVEPAVPGTAIAVLLLLPSLMLLLHQVNSGEGPTIAYVFAACLTSLSMFTFLYVRGTYAAIRHELLGRAARLEAAFMEHALKNSIAKVRLHALNIRQGLAAREYEQAEQSVERLLKTAEQMLQASRQISQAGGPGLVVQADWHDLQQLVDQALEPLRALPNLEIVREDGPCRLYVDAQLVAESLANVFNNSLEAFDGRGTITISLAQTRRHAVLSIRDDGPGLDAWAVAHVFQPFYTAKAQTDTSGNYGLGMPYVQAVMKAHRGRAELQSEPNDGTVVRLTFQRGDWGKHVAG